MDFVGVGMDSFRYVCRYWIHGSVDQIVHKINII